MRLSQEQKLTAIILLSMGIGELLPEPTDAIYFWMQKWLALNVNVLSPLDYWLYSLFSYYCLSAIWYFVLCGVMVAWQVRAERSLLAMIGLISAGGVFGLIIMLVIGYSDFWTMIDSMVILFVAIAILIGAYKVFRDRKHKYI